MGNLKNGEFTKYGTMMFIATIFSGGLNYISGVYMNMVEVKRKNCGRNIYVLDEFIRKEMFCILGVWMNIVVNKIIIKNKGDKK